MRIALLSLFLTAALSAPTRTLKGEGYECKPGSDTSSLPDTISSYSHSSASESSDISFYTADSHSYPHDTNDLEEGLPEMAQKHAAVNSKKESKTLVKSEKEKSEETGSSESSSNSHSTHQAEKSRLNNNEAYTASKESIYDGLTLPQDPSGSNWYEKVREQKIAREKKEAQKREEQRLEWAKRSDELERLYEAFLKAKRAKQEEDWVLAYEMRIENSIAKVEAWFKPRFVPPRSLNTPREDPLPPDRVEDEKRDVEIELLAKPTKQPQSEPVPVHCIPWFKGMFRGKEKLILTLSPERRPPPKKSTSWFCCGVDGIHIVD